MQVYPNALHALFPSRPHDAWPPHLAARTPGAEVRPTSCTGTSIHHPAIISCVRARACVAAHADHPRDCACFPRPNNVLHVGQVFNTDSLSFAQASDLMVLPARCAAAAQLLLLSPRWSSVCAHVQRAAAYACERLACAWVRWDWLHQCSPVAAGSRQRENPTISRLGRTSWAVEGTCQVHEVRTESTRGYAHVHPGYHVPLLGPG